MAARRPRAPRGLHPVASFSRNFQGDLRMTFKEIAGSNPINEEWIGPIFRMTINAIRGNENCAITAQSLQLGVDQESRICITQTSAQRLRLPAQ
jgi:hypothetical protein